MSATEGRALNKFAQFYIALGVTVSSGVTEVTDEGDLILTYYGAVSPRLRDPDAFASFYEDIRERGHDKLEWFRDQLRERREGGAP